MTRVFSTGIEMGDTTEWDAIVPGATGTVTIETTTVRSGTYALKLYSQGIGAYVSHTLATPVSELYVRAAFQFDTNNIENAPVIQLLDSASAELGTVYVGSDNVLHADIGGSDVATGATTLVVDTWYLLEARLKVADSSGIFQVRLDGATEINFSGDTKPGSTTTIDYVRFQGGVTWASSGTTYVDDIGINDTNGTRDTSWCGDGHIVAYAINANGTYTDLAIGGGTPPANAWQAVDEVPANDDTDYIYSTTAAEKSTFTTTPSGLSGVTIKQMWVEARAKEDTATGETIALFLRNGSTDHTGTYTALTTSYTKVFREDHPINPDTSSDWTVNAMDNAEVGVIVG